MMGIPDTLLTDLMHVPRDRRVALLMRHSARFPITSIEDTYLVGLTSEGVRMAEDLGALFGEQFRPGRFLSAPVERCIETGAAVARGAGWQAVVHSDDRLSHPFVVPAWFQVVRGTVNGVVPFEVRVVLDFILSSDPAEPVLDVIVSHDTVLGAVAGSLLKAPMIGPNLPGYLEGIFLWRDETCVKALWRGLAGTFSEKYQRIE